MRELRQGHVRLRGQERQVHLLRLPVPYEEGQRHLQDPRLNAKKTETTIVDELRANILTESNIRNLVKLLDEEMDGAARGHRQKLESIEAELEEVKKQLGRVWHFISKSDSVDVAAASEHIVELRERKENLESAADEARAVLADQRQHLDQPTPSPPSQRR